MSNQLADLCDQYGSKLQIVDPIFHQYGGVETFQGEVTTIRVFNDFLLVKKTLLTPRRNRVLIIDGGGSRQVALLGDKLAQLGVDNQWAGIVINGCIRDSGAIGKLSIGIKALGTCPIKPAMVDEGEQDVRVIFASTIFQPGSYVYADEDGIAVSDSLLT
ncbi:MAG: ribonuclease E activity regulator RraA [Gammaproteobacteria bacterium]|nr:ribonuclease E activity regulator RraA [Gammaproteobacteria bacterium]